MTRPRTTTEFILNKIREYPLGQEISYNDLARESFGRHSPNNVRSALYRLSERENTGVGRTMDGQYFKRETPQT